MTATDIHVRFEDVVKEFPARGKGAKARRGVPAVNGVTFDVHRGDVVGVVGYSGAGKSTLVRLINALERPTSGRLIVGDTDITTLSETQLQKVRGRIGMIFQHFNLFSSRTVAGNVAYPLKVAGWSKTDTDARVAELLDFVGIGDKAQSYPSQLSGGQKQRVGIARALATGPDLLLADEATSALDPDTTTEVLALLRRINQEFGTTIVAITHEMAVVRELCRTVVVMENGALVEAGSTYEVFSRPKTRPGRRFVSTAIHGAPQGDTLRRLHAGNAGTLIAVKINDELGTGDVEAILERHSVRGTAVYGGITEIQEKPLGTLTYELRGQAADIAAVIADLDGRTEVDTLDAETSEADASGPSTDGESEAGRTDKGGIA